MILVALVQFAFFNRTPEMEMIINKISKYAIQNLLFLNAGKLFVELFHFHRSTAFDDFVFIAGDVQVDFCSVSLIRPIL